MLSTIYQIVESARPWRHLTEESVGAFHYSTRTEDGLTLQLRRVRPSSFGGHRSTVMLLHGLGSNHQGFHLPERSLATWLAERGHDVWMPELRGHGSSQAHSYDWCLDEYLDYDIPAIIRAIQRYGGADEIHWVGHSMGGILLMSYGILNPEAPIARGTAVGSALDYGVGQSGFESLLALRPLLERLVAIPYGSLVHLLAPMMGGGPLRSLEQFNVWPTNVEAEIVQQLHARCFHTIPISLLNNLATTFEPCGLCLRSGFPITDNAARLDIPIKLIAGSRDAQVGVEAVEYTSELIGNNADLTICGPEQGCDDHYGHWDLLVGRCARDEVWPEIADWIEG